MMLLGIYNIEIHIEDDFGIHKNILCYMYITALTLVWK